MARPRKTRSSKSKEGMSPDERIAGGLAVAADSPPAEPVKSHTEPDVIKPATICPRANVCIHSADCRQEPDGCGAFSRQEVLTPANREAEKVRAHMEAVRVLEGNDIPEGLRNPVSLFDAMAEARQARLNRDRVPFQLDPRSTPPRPRW